MKGFFTISIVIAALFSQSSAFLKQRIQLKPQMNDLNNQLENIFDSLSHHQNQIGVIGLNAAQRDHNDPNQGRLVTFKAYSDINAEANGFCNVVECEDFERDGLKDTLKIQYNEAAEHDQEDQFLNSLDELRDFYQNKLQQLLANQTQADVKQVKKQLRDKITEEVKGYLNQKL
ncbi:UNKNOWN [Stylonychia lemnae]|uniref:Uncharacterized protein n=1 Tax=Stylonychia lemnae TaxID=5949 RepID=A0A078BDS0_STYLE|nr:UNKNOWN [Stylonychia lemnae]|eukprot:CDW91322.1 UNKNOWN [Stylonychia lemnae]